MAQCIECGRKISKQRLDALPETEYCVKCSPITRNMDTVCSMIIPEIVSEDLLQRMLSNSEET